MVKVLHVINWLRRGGVETQLLQILKNYDRSLLHMDVCCFGSEPGYLESQAREHGAEILHCPKSINLYLFSQKFTDLVSKKGYDVVHCHSEAWSGPVLRGAKHAGIPVRIAHIRSSLPQGFRIRNPLFRLGRDFIMVWGRQWLKKNASHVLGVSKAAMDSRFPYWQKNGKYSLWTLGVDTMRFRLPHPSSRPDRKNKVIINVGSFIPQRRQDLLLKLHRHLLDRMPEVRLVLVGEGEKLDECKKLSRTLGTDDKVEFLGLRDDIPALLSNADIFISCSDAEGLPNTLLEAQAAGLPIVASDIPSHREALHRTTHDFLFRHDNIQLAIDKILKIFHKSEISESLIQKGREFVNKQYNADKNLKILQENYIKWSEDLRIG